MKIALSQLATLALLGVFVTACGVPEEKHKQVLAQKKKLERELSEMKKLSRSQKQRITSLEADLKQVKDSMESKRAALQRKLAELKKTKAALKELEKMKADMEAQRKLDAKLRAQLKSMISAGQLKVVNVNGRLVIKMASKILFPSGKSRLTRKGRRALRKLASILKNVGRHFQVAGHTDNVPLRRRRDDNWSLSTERAVRVVRLLAKNGVPGKNLSAAGFSQHQPVANNRTRKGKALNRRIEITLLPVIPPQVKE